MKKILAASALVAFSASAVFAGGPIIVVEEGQPEVVEAQPTSSINPLWILIPVIACAVACGGDGTSNNN